MDCVCPDDERENHWVTRDAVASPDRAPIPPNQSMLTARVA